MFWHSKMKRLISAYLDNEVSAKEKNLVEEHLKKCTFCRKYYDSLGRLSSALVEYSDEELSPDLEQRIKRNFLGDKYKGVAKMQSKKLIVGISSGALAILVMFVLVGQLQRVIQPVVRDAAMQISGGKEYEPAIGSSQLSWISYEAKGGQRSPALTSGGAGSSMLAQSGSRKIKPAENGQWYSKREFEAETSVNNRRLANSLKVSDVNIQNYAKAGNTYPWIGVTGKPLARYTSTAPDGSKLDEGSLAFDEKDVLAGEGPIVIVEPYLPATGKEDKLIRNADATLEVENIQKVYDEIVKIGKGKNGYLAAANFNESSGGRLSAQIVLRVPKEKFEETIDEVRKLGRVKRFDINSIDISQDYNALVSELNTIKTVYDKIADKLKEKKTDIQQAIRLESELTPIAKRIAAIRNKISEYDNLVSVSTITINLYEVSWKLMIQESLKETKQHFVAFVSSLLKNSVKLLPLLVIICVVGLVCVALAKKLLQAIRNLFNKKSS